MAMTDAEGTRFLAEKCMGWVVKTCDRHEDYSFPCKETLMIFFTDGSTAAYWPSEYTGARAKTWSPFTRIEHAFMLVEKMREKGWTFQIRMNHSEDPTGDVSVDVYCNYGPCVRHGSETSNWHGKSARHSELCRAISLAIIAALEGK